MSADPKPAIPTDSAGPLLLGGVSANELAQRFGTPIYVYDADEIRQRWLRLRQAFSPRVEFLYCLKANPSVALTGLLAELGAGSEVASAGEIHVALAAGQPGHALQFAGPGKSVEDLRTAIEVDLGGINLESEAEYEALAGLARSMCRRPRVAIRINPAHGLQGARMAMAGASKKFGVDVDRVPSLARRILDENLVELRGLHTYGGTQCFDAAAWIEQARTVLALTQRLENELGIALPTVNFGGGFGVPIFAGDPEFDLDAAALGVQKLIDEDANAQRHYHIELGRYLVATSGTYLTRVRYLKTSQGHRHAILDGGMHHHAAAAGLGSIIRRAYPIRLCREVRESATQPTTLGGPLCTPADELARDVLMPELREGDVLAVLVSGAYGLSFSNTLFLSHPTPAEVLVDGGVARVIRAAGRAEDVLRGQRSFAAKES